MTQGKQIDEQLRLTVIRMSKFEKMTYQKITVLTGVSRQSIGRILKEYEAGELKSEAAKKTGRPLELSAEQMAVSSSYNPGLLTTYDRHELPDSSFVLKLRRLVALTCT